MSCIIADLVGTVNNVEQTHKDITYKSVLFPAPALKIHGLLVQTTRQWFKERTFTMNPHEGPARFPFC